MIRDKDQKDRTINLAYRTSHGRAYHGSIDSFIHSKVGLEHQGKVNLIFTSPPFPLNTKKKYGNLQGDAYINWLSGFASHFRKLLRNNGSIVIELGNAWIPGKPVMSTLALRALLAFLEAGKFYLCQQFICYNHARLPSPAQWVNIERCRVKDAYTNVWWLSPMSRPKANNRRILVPYSLAMQQLLSSKRYNAGIRPSEHRIGKKSFLQNNGGAIPSNVLTVANTGNSDPYLYYCRNKGLPLHPARMPAPLCEFFVKFLTTPGDLVLDPFAGSNTTGAVSERLNRSWLAIEPGQDYLAGSIGRFKIDKVRCYL